MKAICLYFVVAIILICGETVSSHFLGGSFQQIQWSVESDHNKLAIFTTLIVWSLPGVFGANVNKATRGKGHQIESQRKSHQLSESRRKVNQAESRRKGHQKSEKSESAEEQSSSKDSNTIKTIINPNIEKIWKLTEKLQKNNNSHAHTVEKTKLRSGSEALKVFEIQEGPLSPLKCFPKALCGVSSEVAQISKRKKNGLVSEYLILMKAIARHPDMVDEVILGKKKKEEEPQKDIEDDASNSEEDDEDKESSDEDEEESDIQSSKKKKKYDEEEIIPKNDDEFYHQSVKEKLQMDSLLKNTYAKEAVEQDLSWWDNTNVDDKPTSWWSSPFSSFGSNRPGPSHSGPDHGPPGNRPPLGYGGPSPGHHGGFGGPQNGPNHGGPPSGFGGGPHHHNGPPGHGGPSGYGHPSRPGPRPYFRGEPLLSPLLETTADMSTTSSGVTGGLTSFVSKLFGFGSDSTISDDPWFQSAARDLSRDLSTASLPGIAMDETREILETAIEIGKSFDKPSQCNEIFNACKYDYTEMLYMIDDLRTNFIDRAKEKQSKKGTKVSKSRTSNTKNGGKEKTTLKTKSKRTKKKKSKTGRNQPTKNKKHSSRPSLTSDGTSEKNSETWVTIPVEPYPQYSQQHFPTLPNVFSWLG